MDKRTSQTMLWPPEQFRHVLRGWSADNVEAMNEKEVTAGTLHEAMWKLLLAYGPRRCSTNHELNLQFKMWRSGQHNMQLDTSKKQTHVAPFATRCNTAI